jgi:hypothetical protein
MFLLPKKVSVEVNKKIYNGSAGCPDPIIISTSGR